MYDDRNFPSSCPPDFLHPSLHHLSYILFSLKMGRRIPNEVTEELVTQLSITSVQAHASAGTRYKIHKTDVGGEVHMDVTDYTSHNCRVQGEKYTNLRRRSCYDVRNRNITMMGCTYQMVEQVLQLEALDTQEGGPGDVDIQRVEQKEVLPEEVEVGAHSGCCRREDHRADD